MQEALLHVPRVRYLFTTLQQIVYRQTCITFSSFFCLQVLAVCREKPASACIAWRFIKTAERIMSYKTCINKCLRMLLSVIAMKARRCSQVYARMYYTYQLALSVSILISRFTELPQTKKARRYETLEEC